MQPNDQGTLQTRSLTSRAPHLATGLAIPATLAGWACVGLWLLRPDTQFPTTPAVAVAIAYLVAAIWHPAGRYLRNLHPVEDVVAYIGRMRAIPPMVRFTGDCYHHELRTKWITETYMDSDGKLQQREVPRDEWERVTTLCPSQDFAYAGWSDRSARLTDAIYQHQAVCVDFRLIAVPADPPTASAYAAARSAFLAKYANHDACFDFAEVALATGFKPKMLSVVDMARKSPALSLKVYVTLALLGLLAPYLLWFELRTTAGSFHFRKLFSTVHGGKPMRNSANDRRVYPKVYPRTSSAHFEASGDHANAGKDWWS